MRYYKRFYTTYTPVEVSYKDALEELLQTYKDTPKNRAMLQSRGKFRCLFCDIIVEE